MEAQQEVKFPRLGEPAPEFDAVTTHGPIRLRDYAGKWLVLFSHPGDFTPVCTTEFVAFAEIHDELQGLGVELLGLSVDSVTSHIAWVRNIEEKLGCRIPFPIIADLNKNISVRYGMLHDHQSRNATVRCVFVIGPDQLLRAMIYYPLSTGRSMPEILRLVKALQISDRTGLSTPANWKPGDMMIMPPPTTQKGAEERMEQGYECKEWYFCRAPVD